MSAGRAAKGDRFPALSTCRNQAASSNRAGVPSWAGLVIMPGRGRRTGLMRHQRVAIAFVQATLSRSVERHSVDESQK